MNAGTVHTDVVQIFPTTESVIRLVGALLVEMNDEMIAADRRCRSRTETSNLLGDPPGVR